MDPRLHIRTRVMTASRESTLGALQCCVGRLRGPLLGMGGLLGVGHARAAHVSEKEDSRELDSGPHHRRTPRPQSELRS
jgi:hypothetical protein